MSSAIKHIMAVLLLPGVMAVAIPTYILVSSHVLRPGGALPFPVNVALAFIGLIFICLGLTLMVKTNALFARVGKGTLAPWTPTKHLVVQGIYLRVRNPMITGVFCILLGEATAFYSWRLLIWFGIFVLINMIFIPLLEEPDLETRFGEDYRVYKKNVSRWIPRLKPWKPAFDSRKEDKQVNGRSS